MKEKNTQYSGLPKFNFNLKSDMKVKQIISTQVKGSLKEKNRAVTLDRYNAFIFTTLYMHILDQSTVKLNQIFLSAICLYSMKTL